MQIRCKFGQLGPGKGQFNSPHGFCLGLEEEIIVADTNNHRIQVLAFFSVVCRIECEIIIDCVKTLLKILNTSLSTITQVFEKNGTFRYQFGIPGKEEGQLWYPRKVIIL